MAYSEKIADRVREALSQIRKVEEKKMFSGVAFMVNGKMCITVGPDRIMCRIDPGVHEEALTHKGSKTMTMKGREYIGFVQVSEEGIRSTKDFEYWVNLALEFNKVAKASKKRKPKKTAGRK